MGTSNPNPTDNQTMDGLQATRPPEEDHSQNLMLFEQNIRCAHTPPEVLERINTFMAATRLNVRT